MPRLFKLSETPPQLTGIARYPNDGRISGALNEATRNAMQAWADGALRCPVIVYASTDNHSKTANGSDLSRIIQENLWLYNDHTTTAPRMYAIDYSGYYTIPEKYRTTVTVGAYSFPRPIILGDYGVLSPNSGPRSSPVYHHNWDSVDVEITPQNLIGQGGNNGVGLTPEQLSTFKVVRTAAHFECYGYFDSVNAYDNVTISFGPCHWTLARCSPGEAPDGGREMPAFLAYVKQAYATTYRTFFEVFGLMPARTWPITISNIGTYISKITIQTEGDPKVLCGASGDTDFKFAENTYGKNWHFFYRFQMACRTATDLQRAMWDFTRFRIRDILNRRFTIAGSLRRVGDYITSEKGVAMLLRWHIYLPAHVYGNENRLWGILSNIIGDYSVANQARENEILRQLSNIGGPPTRGHLTEIFGWENTPQMGLNNYPYYRLNLTNRTLSSRLGSFYFEDP